MNPLLLYFMIYTPLIICYQIAENRGVLNIALEKPVEHLFMASMSLAFAGAILCLCFMKHRADVPRVKNHSRIELLLIEKIILYAMVPFVLSVFYKHLVMYHEFGTIFPDLERVRIAYTSGDLIAKYGIANWMALILQIYLSLNLGILLGARPSLRVKLLVPIYAATVVMNDHTLAGAAWSFIACMFVFVSACSSYEIISDRRISWKHILVFIVCMVLFWQGALQIFKARGVETSDAAGSQSTNIILFYTGGNLATLQYFYDRPIPASPPGRHLFGGIYDPVNRLLSPIGMSFLPEADPWDYIAFVPLPNNTPIYLSLLCADFGISGSLVASTFLGAFAVFIYVKTIRKRRAVDVQILVMVLLSILISFRHILTEGMYVFVLIGVYILQNKMVSWYKLSMEKKMPVPIRTT